MNRYSEVTDDPPRLPDTEIFYAMPSGSDTVIVSFGAKGGGHGHFHFLKLLKPLPDISKLLVRDPAGAWYNAGLPGVGDSIEEIAQRIGQEAARLGATRIVTSGSSMGGYGAILFGCMLGAERVIALGPQTRLDAGLRHAPPADVGLQAPDLEPIIRQAPATQVDVVAGWNDHVDILHAQHIAGLPTVRILAVRDGTHSFVTDLHSEGRLFPLLRELIEGGTPELCEVNPPLDVDVEQRIADTAYATHRRQWDAVVERIGPVAERYPEWAGPNFDLGRALVEMDDLAAAEAPLRRAVQINPRWTQPRAYLASSLLRQGRPADAEQPLREGLARNEEWAYGNLCLARCLMRLGRRDEGRRSARRAAELDESLTEAVEKLLG